MITDETLGKFIFWRFLRPARLRHTRRELWLNRDGSGRAEILVVHRSKLCSGDYMTVWQTVLDHLAKQLGGAGSGRISNISQFQIFATSKL